MNRSTITLIVLGVIVLVLAFFQTPLMHGSRQFVWDGWTRLVAHVFRIKDAYENSTIENRLQDLVSENTHLKAELADYQRLRQDLGSNTVESLRPVNAAVVGRPLDTLQSELVISQGIESGVAIGDPVIIHGSTLIGFVSETTQRSAVVQTLLHPNTYVTVEVVNEDEGAPPAKGLLQSKSYAALYVTTIPRDVTIKKDQSVVTVSEDVKTPPGLVIGKVSSIESEEHDAYQTARITPDYDIDTVRAVTVLAKP